MQLVWHHAHRFLFCAASALVYHKLSWQQEPDFIVLLQMKRNRQLNRFFIRDFNKDPSDWAEKDNTFDAVVCCVSVQYMQQPERVFAEMHRVLKPGGVCIMTFSSRLFYSKAIQGWRDNSAYGRVSLVKQYFQCIKGIVISKTVAFQQFCLM